MFDKLSGVFYLATFTCLWDFLRQIKKTLECDRYWIFGAGADIRVKKNHDVDSSDDILKNTEQIYEHTFFAMIPQMRLSKTCEKYI